MALDLRVLEGNTVHPIPDKGRTKKIKLESEPVKVGRKVKSDERLEMMQDVFEIADVEAILDLSRSTAWALVKKWVEQNLVTKHSKRHMATGLMGYELRKRGVEVTELEKLNTKRQEKAIRKYTKMLATLPYEFTTSQAAWYWKVKPARARDYLYSAKQYGLVEHTGYSRIGRVISTWMKN